MTYKEKVEVIEKFRNEAGGAAAMLLIAHENEDTEAITKISNKLKEAYLPVVEMYTNELNKAINPTHTSTAPIVVMLLRQTLNGIIRHNPEAEKAADMFDKLFPSEVWEIGRKRDE